MACAPVEQAVTTAWFGPLKPWRIETWPEARLIRRPGMKNGLTRRGPFSCSRIDGLGDAVEAADARADQHAGALLLLLVSGFQPASSSACVGGGHARR